MPIGYRKTAHAAANSIGGDTQIPERLTKAPVRPHYSTIRATVLNEGIIRNYITPAMGAVELQAVKGVHVQRLYNTMTKGGLSGKTVKNAAAVRHKALGVAVKQGIIPANPCDAAELPKVERHEIKPLTDQEIPLFLAAIEGNPMQNAYTLCLFAGLREGECLGLSWKQVDFQKGRLTISQQLQREKGKGRYISPATKSGKPRTIEPPPIAFEYLQAERTKQQERRLRAGPAGATRKNWSSPMRQGIPILSRSFIGTSRRLPPASVGRTPAPTTFGTWRPLWLSPAGRM